MFSTRTTMQVKIEKKEGFVVFNIKELELDSNNSPTLKDSIYSLSNEGYKNMVIDMTNTKYCNSSGLSALLVANRLCKKQGGVFVLSGINESVHRLIKISQLDSILQICESVTDAEQFINKISAQ